MQTYFSESLVKTWNIYIKENMLVFAEFYTTLKTGFSVKPVLQQELR